MGAAIFSALLKRKGMEGFADKGGGGKGGAGMEGDKAAPMPKGGGTGGGSRTADPSQMVNIQYPPLTSQAAPAVGTGALAQGSSMAAPTSPVPMAPAAPAGSFAPPGGGGAWDWSQDLLDPMLKSRL